ncbi:MAG: preprotein translocase subunit SecY, partial [candidate division NC10 bacterium]|nr:preprotein translocase subunit SecY [candidate division NC10 bacterium]
MINQAANIFRVPELRKRVIFTCLLLIVYRLGSHVPTPGIDAEALTALFDQVGGTLFGFLDLFSGGALRRLSVFALGIVPYIGASIVLQLLARRIAALTLVAGTIFLMWLGEQISERGIGTGISLLIFAGIIVRLPEAVGGSFRLLQSGEMAIFISERGIGNGISLLIFAGIIVRLPEAVGGSFRLLQSGEMAIFT